MQDKECDFSFFWECLCSEYESIMNGDLADKEHENLFKGAPALLRAVPGSSIAIRVCAEMLFAWQ